MLAAQSTMASLAISAGWMVNGPTASQFLLPLISTPKRATSPSRTRAKQEAGIGQPADVLIGIRDATHAAGRPSATQSSCRFTTA